MSAPGSIPTCRQLAVGTGKTLSTDTRVLGIGKASTNQAVAVIAVDTSGIISTFLLAILWLAGIVEWT